MSNRSLKQSQFQVVTSMPSGAYMPLWGSGVNYGITYTNFLSGLGVTGTIVQDGDVTGVPVLDIQGTVNNIRNIEPGAGIYAEVSAENGIAIRHNFTVDSVGEPLILNGSSSSPDVVSLVAGDGISLSTSGKQITIALSSPISSGNVSMQANATATTIADTSTPVLVAGTWTPGTSTGFTASTAGRLTCTTSTTHTYNVAASICAAPASGSDQQISMYLAKNGAVIAESRMQADISSTAAANIATSWPVELAANDYVEIYVQNESATNNVLVSRAILRAF